MGQKKPRNLVLKFQCIFQRIVRKKTFAGSTVLKRKANLVWNTKSISFYIFIYIKSSIHLAAAVPLVTVSAQTGYNRIVAKGLLM